MSQSIIGVFLFIVMSVLLISVIVFTYQRPVEQGAELSASADQLASNRDSQRNETETETETELAVGSGRVVGDGNLPSGAAAVDGNTAFLTAFLAEKRAANEEMLRYALVDIGAAELGEYKRSVHRIVADGIAGEIMIFQVFPDVTITAQAVSGSVNERGQYYWHGHVIESGNIAGYVYVHIMPNDTMSAGFRLSDAEYQIMPASSPPTHLVFRRGFYTLHVD